MPKSLRGRLPSYLTCISAWDFRFCHRTEMETGKSRPSWLHGNKESQALEYWELWWFWRSVMIDDWSRTNIDTRPGCCMYKGCNPSTRKIRPNILGHQGTGKWRVVLLFQRCYKWRAVPRTCMKEMMPMLNYIAWLADHWVEQMRPFPWNLSTLYLKPCIWAANVRMHCVNTKSIWYVIQCTVKRNLPMSKTLLSVAALASASKGCSSAWAQIRRAKHIEITSKVSNCYWCASSWLFPPIIGLHKGVWRGFPWHIQHSWPKTCPRLDDIVTSWQYIFCPSLLAPCWLFPCSVLGPKEVVQ